MKFIFFTNGVWPQKYDQAIKKSNFNFVIEYPIWASIKITLTGKLGVDGQNFIYCVQIQENIQKQSESECFQNSAISEVFGLFL